MDLGDVNKIFSIASLIMISCGNCMNPEEEIDFINIASIWRKGHSFHLEDCLFISFGYDRGLPYTKIDLSLQENMDIVINTKGVEAKNGCLIVLIAGKYVRQVDEVMKRMDDIAEQTQFVPLATFIFEDFANNNVKIDNRQRSFFQTK